MGKTIGQLVSTYPATALSTLDYIELEQGGNSTGGTIGQLSSYIIPPGSMNMFAGSSIPSGWLLCDGSQVSRTTYANLFTAIGTTWGVGDNSTTFNLPDMREACPQGAGTYSAVTGTTHGTITAHDARALGAFADDQGQGHYHGFRNITAGTTPDTIGTISSSTASPTAVTGGAAGQNITLGIGSPTSDGTNGTPRTGTVTRGKTIGVNYIIKY
jgi:Microcystin-dependent protein